MYSHCLRLSVVKGKRDDVLNRDISINVPSNVIIVPINVFSIVRYSSMIYFTGC